MEEKLENQKWKLMFYSGLSYRLSPAIMTTSFCFDFEASEGLKAWEVCTSIRTIRTVRESGATKKKPLKKKRALSRPKHGLN